MRFFVLFCFSLVLNIFSMSCMVVPESNLIEKFHEKNNNKVQILNSRMKNDFINSITFDKYGNPKTIERCFVKKKYPKITFLPRFPLGDNKYLKILNNVLLRSDIIIYTIDEVRACNDNKFFVEFYLFEKDIYNEYIALAKKLNLNISSNLPMFFSEKAKKVNWPIVWDYILLNNINIKSEFDKFSYCKSNKEKLVRLLGLGFVKNFSHYDSFAKIKAKLISLIRKNNSSYTRKIFANETNFNTCSEFLIDKCKTSTKNICKAFYQINVIKAKKLLTKIMKIIKSGNFDSSQEIVVCFHIELFDMLQSGIMLEGYKPVAEQWHTAFKIQ